MFKQINNQGGVSDELWEKKNFKNLCDHLDFCTVGFWNKNKILTLNQ